MKKWRLLSDRVPASLDALKEILLKNREIAEEEVFFNPVHPGNFSPTELEIDEISLAKALERIKHAGEKKEKVVLFGDYDADGICGTAILWRVLHRLDFNVIPFIPDRHRHGYGLSVVALEEVVEQHQPNLIITIDNGIVAHEAAEWLKEKQIDLIITDHHVRDGSNPSSVATVQTTQLCGASLVWVVARELVEYLEEGEEKQGEVDLEKLLDLAGIATIADQVPLLGANRSFARYGLRQLKKTKNDGLKVLLELASIDQKTVTEWSIGFGLAPRINAAGRLADPMDALRLLCTGSRKQAQQLGKKINRLNQERQELTSSAVELAREQALAQKDSPLLLIHSTDFHEGVIGLVAGRLTESWSKPAIVMSEREGLVKASARSVEGINMVQLVRSVERHLLSVGGHKMAAGFSLLPENLELLVADLQDQARELTESLGAKEKTADCVLPAHLVTQKILGFLKLFRPFGQGNAEPLFRFDDWTVSEMKWIGKEKQHLRLVLTSADQKLTALIWRAKNRSIEVEKGQEISFVGQLQENLWNGRVYLQCVVRELVG